MRYIEDRRAAAIKDAKKRLWGSYIGLGASYFVELTGIASTVLGFLVDENSHLFLIAGAIGYIGGKINSIKLKRNLSIAERDLEDLIYSNEITGRHVKTNLFSRN